MNMRNGLWILAAAILVFGCALGGWAQGSPDRGATPGVISQPDKKGGEIPSRDARLACSSITDGGYDGTIGSMTCLDVAGPNVTITDVNLVVAIDHTWIGDLVIKVRNPAGTTVVTVLSRPGYAESADDGSGCCGDSSNLSSSYPITFDDQSTGPSAENMGSTINSSHFVCQDDGFCSFIPSAGAATPGLLSAFNGQNASGTWKVCVGDAGAGDTGQFCSASLVFNNAQAGDLALTKTADTKTPKVGGAVTFTLTATNNGPGNQSGVVVTDPLPANLTYLSNTCGAAAVGNTVTWSIGNLAKGASASCDIVATVSQCGTVTNTATISGTGSDPVPDNNSASYTLFSNIVADPGFEAGTPNPSWTESSVAFSSPICDTSICGTGNGTAGPHSGTWWCWFGGSSTGDTASVEQDVIIPAGTADLSFWVWYGYQGDATDRTRALLDGNVIWHLNGSSSNYATYGQVNVDVSDYADGDTHLLRFESHSTGSYNLSLDDVALVACPSPSCSITSCSATVPASAAVNVSVSMSASVVVSGSCTDTPSYAWSFGDTQTGTGQSVTHQYTAPGTYTWSMTVTVGGKTCTQTGSIVICSALSISPSSLTAGTAGVAYTPVPFSQTGGVGTITWSETGALPTGMSFNAGTATLSGTPTKTGSFPITVTATDGNSCTGSQNLTLVINCPTITVTPSSLSNGTAGVAYTPVPFSQTGGVGTITWSETGALPTGMTFTAATATLAGTPTQTGSFPITVTATDGNNCTGSRNLSLVINCPTITVTPSSLSNGTAGVAYTPVPFSQTGGVGTITWSETGALPTGMSFNAGTATLSGTPTKTGSFPITVTATDGNSCTGSQNLTLVINCPTITVTPSSLSNGTAGVAYTPVPFSQTGGVGTITWSETGALPTGMTFTAATATLAGTPTQTGSFPITVTATDGNNCTGSRNLSLVINCPTITVTPSSLSNGTAGVAYTPVPFSQTGGVGTITWSETGALPTGMSFTAATATLSGTPTKTGSFPITVTATDGNNCTGSRNLTLTINCPTITVSPSSLSAGTAGVAYTPVPFSQTGGVGTIAWSETGALPTGMSFTAATGTLSGTPTKTGSFPITVTATDSNICTGSRNLTLVINCPAITVSPSSLSNGTAGVAYTPVPFSQTGGVGTIAWSETGALPTGMSFTAATGTLSGTPTKTGSFPITVTATDSNICTGSRNLTLVINCPTITVSPSSLSNGTAGVAYTPVPFSQTGGVGTIAWSETGALPTGMSFTAATGTLSGTPTKTGSFPITVTATDSNICTGSRNLTLVINCPTITVSPSSLSNGTAGVAYTPVPFSQTGGVGTIAWSETGALPTGMSFTAATGTLSGTPTKTGSFPITVTATDSNICTGSRNLTLVINCPTITVSPSSLSNGTAGVAYTPVPFSQTGGVGTIAWSETGALPTGMSFTAATGTLSGTPTKTGSFPITVTATDSNICTGSRNLTLVINCPTITVSPSSLSNGTAGVAYTAVPFSQTGGVGTIAWSETGALPTGMSFTAATATLSGTPTQSGNFPVTFTATDSNRCTGSRSLTLVVVCPTIALSPALLPGGIVAYAYSQLVTASGSTGTYSYTVTSGTTPPGLVLSSAGALSGTPTAAGAFTFTVTATDSYGCKGSIAYTVKISAYDMSFTDDALTSQACVNSRTGAWRWSVLKGTGMGQSYGSIGVLQNTSDGFTLSSKTTESNWATRIQFFQREHQATGFFAYMAKSISSNLTDINTLNDPPGCGGY